MIGALVRLASSVLALATIGCAGQFAPYSAKSAARSCEDALGGSSEVAEFVVTGAGGRAIPLEVVYPSSPGRYPLIGFSHGAFAAPDRYRKMLRPLAAAGYVVLAPMHPDSEEFSHAQAPSPAQVWNARVEDLSLALDTPAAAIDFLASNGITVDRAQIVAMGHSYGALMAQIAAGARANDPNGHPTRFTPPPLAGVIGWSPPGSIPGTIELDGWRDVTVPSLVLTGTADTLSPNQAWTWHEQGFASMPKGNKTLWVGDSIDHYFGGTFGREKVPPADSARLFGRALAHVLSFLDRATGRENPCMPGGLTVGETLTDG